MNVNFNENSTIAQLYRSQAAKVMKAHRNELNNEQ